MPGSTTLLPKMKLPSSPSRNRARPFVEGAEADVAVGAEAIGQVATGQLLGIADASTTMRAMVVSRGWIVRSKAADAAKGGGSEGHSSAHRAAKVSPGPTQRSDRSRDIALRAGRVMARCRASSMVIFAPVSGGHPTGPRTRTTRMKPIQMVDLVGQYEKIKPEVDAAVLSVMAERGLHQRTGGEGTSRRSCPPIWV